MITLQYFIFSLNAIRYSLAADIKYSRVYECLVFIRWFFFYIWYEFWYMNFYWHLFKLFSEFTIPSVTYYYIIYYVYIVSIANIQTITLHTLQNSIHANYKLKLFYANIKLINNKINQSLNEFNAKSTKKPVQPTIT